MTISANQIGRWVGFLVTKLKACMGGVSGGGAIQAGWLLNEGYAIVEIPGIVSFGVKLPFIK